MIAFIDAYRDHFGVEFICQTLVRNREGGFMTARGYRAAKAHPICIRHLRDCELIPVMMDVQRNNYSVLWGA